MRDLTLHPFEVRPLTNEEGGGYLISFLDFSECISDGEAPEEAIRNGLDALTETIAAPEDMGLPVTGHCVSRCRRNGYGSRATPIERQRPVQGIDLPASQAGTHEPC